MNAQHLFSHWYYLDETGHPHPVTSWDEMRLHDHQRRIAETTIGDIYVSTVFLGLDHRCYGLDPDGPPIMFETMVFGGEFDQSQERYTSITDAHAGHRRWVAQVSHLDESVEDFAVRVEALLAEVQAQQEPHSPSNDPSPAMLTGSRESARDVN